jgi:hypothetical protein
MKTVTVITIDGNKFGLPEGLPAKDLRELIGFLHNLSAIGTQYDWENSQDLCMYDNGPVTIKVSQEEIVDKAQARIMGKESQDRYELKKAEERKAKEATAQ